MCASKLGSAKRLDGLRRLLTQVHELLAAKFGFVLWDGSTVPADLPSNALAIVIADEGVVGAIIRRPNLHTLANLWVTARIDIRNGSIFDVVANRPKVGARWILGALDKPLALATAARFLLVPRGGPWPLDSL